MKGLSQIISAIVLIGIAITMSVLVSNWIAQWSTEHMETSSSSCALNTNYVIDSITFKNSTNTMTIKITNKNSRTLYGFSIQLENASDILVFNSSDGNITFSPNITASNRLERGRSAFVKLNLTRYPSMGTSTTNVKVFNQVCSAVYTERGDVVQEA